jgi:hypothetical protein
MEVGHVGSVVGDTSDGDPFSDFGAVVEAAVLWHNRVHLEKLSLVDKLLEFKHLILHPGLTLIKETSFREDFVDDHINKRVDFHVGLGNFGEHLLPLDPFFLGSHVSLLVHNELHTV